MENLLFFVSQNKESLQPIIKFLNFRTPKTLIFHLGQMEN